MAGCTQSGRLTCGILLLLLAARLPLGAQVAAGSLAGRVTDLHSRPLDGVALTLRNRATGAEVHATAGKNGSYRFASLGPGEYILEAESAGLGHGHLEGITIVAGHEARVQAALAFAPEPPAPAPVHVPPRSAVQAQVVYSAPAPPPAPVLVPAPSAVPTLTRQSLSAQLAPQDLAPGPILVHSTAAPESVHPAPPELQAASVAAPPFPAQRETLAPLAERAVPLLLPPTSALAVSSGPAIPAQLAVVTVPPALLSLRASAVALAPPASRSFGSAASPLLRAAAASAHAALLDAARESLTAAALQADEPALQTQAQTIAAAELQSLPLDGGAWESVALEARQSAPDDSNFDPAASHQFSDPILVDGIDTRLAFGARTSGRQQGRSASLIGPGSGDTVLREVQTAAGGATASRGAGSRARVQTARGGDQLHGQASFSTRQGIWGAQNPNTEWMRETTPATSTAIPQFLGQPFTPDQHETAWSLTVGDRIAHTHMHWFASVSSHLENIPAVSIPREPDDFFAQPTNDSMQVLAARLNLSSANPVGEGIAAYSGLLETLSGLLGPAPRTAARFTGFARLDGSLGQRSRFTVEGTGANRDAPGGGLSGGAQSYGSHSYGASQTSEQWIMARWEALLSPHLVAIAQASFGHHDLVHAPETPSPFEQSLNISSWQRLPQIIVDSRYGLTIGNPARFGTGSYPDEQIYRAQEQLAWTHRTLELRAGFELSHNTDTTTFLRNQTGTYTYSRIDNFISDTLSFQQFGLSGQLDPVGQHNCDAEGKPWHDSSGQLRGIGALPCYSHYTQTIGPNVWWLRTNDWGSYVAASWRPGRRVTLSLAARWDLQQAPPPLAQLVNPDLPLAGLLPSFGSEWGPRAGLAWMPTGHRGPTLRFGYGLYFSRTPNATLQTALTQTGSANGDLKYFLRATDDLNSGGAPPFPYVLAARPTAGARPEAVEFAPGFHNSQIHQAAVSVEQVLPGHIHMEAAIAAALARHLPLLLDSNIDPAVNPGTITYSIVDGNGTGPLKSTQLTVPFYASWPTPSGATGRLNPNYQQIGEAFSRANSTYQSASLLLSRTARAGLTLRARYTYGHTTDWNPDDSVTFSRPSVLDPTNLAEEYGTSDLDVRHTAALAFVWQPRWSLHAWPGKLANGWRFASTGTYRSGLPFTMRTSGTVPREFNIAGTAIVGLGSGMSGYGGDNRVYGVGRNTFRYPQTWKADVRLARQFHLGEMRELELLAESFNLFNHQNVNELETIGYTIDSGTASGGLPSLQYLTGLKTGQTEFGHPLDINGTEYFRPRQLQLGLRLRF